jgi:hypothetical protein
LELENTSDFIGPPKVFSIIYDTHANKNEKAKSTGYKITSDLTPRKSYQN